MYDIQNALRRRALAERLEALRHAADAAERATSAAAAEAALDAAAEAQGRPRHLADDLSLPPSDGVLYEEAPPAPYVGVQPTPYMTPPSIPYSPPPPPYPAGPAAPAGPGAPTAFSSSSPAPVRSPAVPADELVPVGAPDQTTVLDVQTLRVERPSPPPLRAGSVDDAQTPLEPIDLPLDDPASAEVAAAFVAVPVAGAPGVAGAPAGKVAETTADAGPGQDDEAGSPAAAIADLLRGGGSSLFFQRNSS